MHLQTYEAVQDVQNTMQNDISRENGAYGQLPGSLWVFQLVGLPICQDRLFENLGIGSGYPFEIILRFFDHSL